MALISVKLVSDLKKVNKGDTVLKDDLVLVNVFDNIINNTSSWIEEDSNTMKFIGSATNQNGGIDVNIQDQTTELIDLYVSIFIQVITIAIATSLDDIEVNIDAAQDPLVGNLICFKEGNAFYQGIILTVVDNTGGNYTITLDTPLDFAFTILGGCSERTEELNVNGNIPGGIIASLSPRDLAPGVKWDLVRMNGIMLATTAMDDGKFGGIPALTKGVVFRKKDGVHKNIFNAKTNGDLRLRMYDVTYSDKAPAGQNGVTFRRTWGGQSKNGVVIRLIEETNDEYQIIIQDDLTALSSFRVVAQGHVVE